MQHETATVKKVVKRYKTVNGDEKESISYNAKVSAKSGFKDGDEVVIIPADDFDEINNVDVAEFQQLKNDVADRDATIVANNESIAKLNAELKSKLNLINETTGKLKASEKTVADLRDDVSAKDKIIAELKSELNVANATIDDVTAERDSIHSKLNELSDVLSSKNSIIDDLDSTIKELEKDVAVYDAIDISGLKDKAKELEKANKVIIRLQSETKEYILLNAYKDKKIDALENKGALDYILNRNVTAGIPEPTLLLIDSSGNPITDNDAELEIDKIAESNDDATDDNGDATPDDDDSGKDTLTII